MLIDKPIAENNVVTFRLVTGEEIIGRYAGTTTTGIKVKRPLILQIHLVGENQASIAFVPFMAAIDETTLVPFIETAMMTRMMRPREQVEQNYVRATTGLEVAPNTAGLIL